MHLPTPEDAVLFSRRAAGYPRIPIKWVRLLGRWNLPGERREPGTRAGAGVTPLA